MTDLRTAAQQALEALAVATNCLDGYYIPRGKTTLPEIEDAITALRAALAEPVPDSKHATISEWSADKQRKPLTEEEIDSIWDSEKAFADIYAIARAIERAHGIGEHR